MIMHVKRLEQLLAHSKCKPFIIVITVISMLSTYHDSVIKCITEDWLGV